MTRILVADDDLALADVLAFTLKRAGFDVALAHSGREALSQSDAQSPDLIVLDWMLPDIDGLRVCRELRSQSSVPIIMLTVRYGDDDVVAALEAGADEYITKPFSPRQMVARVRALLRRVGRDEPTVLKAGSLALDLERYEALCEGQPPLHLTRLETRLLEALVQNPDRVLATQTLIARIWGQDGATPEMLKQLVYRLRTKLDGRPDLPVRIDTVQNAGYLLRLTTEG